MIFGSLKGIPAAKLDNQVRAVIEQVGLSAKTDQQSCTLSGGMKRKLSIGIAVVGDSHLIFLDEPSSGMDPYSRKATWVVIRRLLERDPVVIFTTHFMDEADILGDRIAIMSDGQLRCCGSPLYLKQAFGLGYNLTLSATVGKKLDWDPLLSIVHRHINGAKMLSSAGSEMAFQLPGSSVAQFPELFGELEQQQQLGDSLLDSWGISITTLEEVFLTLAKQERQSTEPGAEAEASASGSTTLGERVVLTGCSKFWTHALCLMSKRYKTTAREPISWVLIVLVPVLFILIAVVAVLYGFNTDVEA